MKTTIKIENNEVSIDNYEKDLLVIVLAESAGVLLSEEVIEEILSEPNVEKYTEGVTKEWTLDISIEGNSIDANFNEDLNKEDMVLLLLVLKGLLEEEEQEI